MHDFWLIWLIAALLNFFIFIRIDWGLLKSNWNMQVWIITLVCCLIPPIGWAMLIVLWHQYRRANND
jgi:hypothetical protein